MKKKFLIFAIIFALVSFMFVLSGCPNNEDDGEKNTVVQGVGNRTFYVSKGEEGDDANDGLSEDKPIRTLTKVNSLILGPNDKVLFQEGWIWHCADEDPPTALAPKGRGEPGENRSIVIGSYPGNGNRPVIAGSGLTEAIRIERTEYMKITGLEITNNDERGYMQGSVINPNIKGAKVRRGIFVNVEHRDYRLPSDNYLRRDDRGRSTPEFGAMRGIVIEDNIIHSVYGYAIHAENGDNPYSENPPSEGRWWYCGGIYIKNSSQDYNGGCMGRVNMGLPVGRIVDPIIRDNYFYDVWSTAIYADHNPGTWHHLNGNDGLDYAFTGLLVEGNVIRHTGSEAIALTNGFWDFEINRNGIYDIGYLHQQAKGWFMGVIYVGNNSVTQNNEIARMIWTHDSHGFDNDIGCYGLSLIQYNYVRDLTGSFLMNWGGNWAGEAATIVRYNISVNNGGWGPADPGEVTLILNTNSNTFFYNNIFYNDKQQPIRIRSGSLDHAAFINNVFWTNAPTVLDLSTWKNMQADGNNLIYFDHNMYYNAANVVVDSQTNYHLRLGASWSDANRITSPNGNPFGKFAAAPGGAGSNENRAGAGYSSLIFGTHSIRSKDELASFFKIDNTSDLYQKGRPITKKLVDDYIWGVTGSVIPFTQPHASTVQRGDRNTFNRYGGRDFFDNPIPNPEDSSAPRPSVGVHNP